MFNKCIMNLMVYSKSSWSLSPCNKEQSYTLYKSGYETTWTFRLKKKKSSQFGRITINLNQYTFCKLLCKRSWFSQPIMMQESIDPFRIRRATSVPLGKGTKFALHHGKMSTTKRRTIQILHISTFQFTFKCGYNYLISKYTDINSLHVTHIDLLYNDTFCST